MQSGQIISVIKLLTSLDGGYIDQGCWSWGGDGAETSVSRTRVAVQSRGPGNTHGEVTYLSWAAPPIRPVRMRVAVCLHMQTNGLLYLL